LTVRLADHIWILETVKNNITRIQTRTRSEITCAINIDRAQIAGVAAVLPVVALFVIGVPYDVVESIEIFKTITAEFRRAGRTAAISRQRLTAPPTDDASLILLRGPTSALERSFGHTDSAIVTLFPRIHRSITTDELAHTLKIASVEFPRLAEGTKCNAELASIERRAGEIRNNGDCIPDQAYAARTHIPTTTACRDLRRGEAGTDLLPSDTESSIIALLAGRLPLPPAFQGEDQSIPADV